MPTQRLPPASKLKYSVPRIKLYLVHEGKTAGGLYALGHPLDAEAFLEPLKYVAEEHFVSLHLNAQNEVIGLHEVSHGTLVATLVHPREVFKAAFMANSHSILVCHNHPSGGLVLPSKEDLLITRQLLRAGLILGVNLIDHLILSPNQVAYSIRHYHPEIWKC